MGWLKRLWHDRQLDADLDAELQFHVDEEVDRLVREGLPVGEARRRALAAFGGLAPIRELTRDVRGTRWLGDLVRDTHYAIRAMRRTPGFTTIAVLSLAVGIGANAAVFSVMDALMLQPLPIDRPGETFVLARTGFEELNTRLSYPMVEHLRAQVPGATFSAMTGPLRVQVGTAQGVELALGQLVTGNWFQLLGVQPSIGRLLSPADDERIDGHHVVVISDAFWRRRFNRDPAVLERPIDLNDVPVTVVGVAAASFDGPFVGRSIDVWAPVLMQHALRHQTNASIEGVADTSTPWAPQEDIRWLTVFGRADRMEWDSLGRHIDEVYRRRLADAADAISSSQQRAARLREHVVMQPGAHGLSDVRNDFSLLLTVLMGTVAMVLLIACANLAGLLLARSVARERELALRVSLGAGRGRLVRQLLTETILLSIMGGVVGLAVAVWGSRMLLFLVSAGGTAVTLDVGLNWRTFLFTFAASVLTGLVFGLVPARRLVRVSLHGALRDGGAVVRNIVPHSRMPAARLLIAGQVALSVVLLAGAILFVETLTNLLRLPAGFARDEVVSARFDPKLAGIGEAELPGLYERLRERAAAIPGVRHVSLAYTGIVTGSEWSGFIVAEGRPPVPDGDDNARQDLVDADYLKTVGLPLLRGRDFGPGDRAGSPIVAVVNEAFARHFFGDADPVGRRFGFSEDRLDREIIGVVADARVDGPRRDVPPLVLYAQMQDPDRYLFNLYVRVDGSAESVKPELARVVAAADPRLAVREVVTLNELTARTLVRERLLSALTLGAAVLAAAVACLGLFGTVSYSVSGRTTELGIRIALGASAAAVRGMVLRDVAWLVGSGCLAGLALAMAGLRAVDTLLFGLSSSDPLALGASTALLLAVGVASGLLPAWRASRVDPIRALRAG